MPNLGPTELILILLIVIAVFGAGKLANLGGALGKGVKDFRSAMQTEGEDKDEEDGETNGGKEGKADAPTAKGADAGEDEA